MDPQNSHKPLSAQFNNKKRSSELGTSQNQVARRVKAPVAQQSSSSIVRSVALVMKSTKERVHMLSPATKLLACGIMLVSLWIFDQVLTRVPDIKPVSVNRQLNPMGFGTRSEVNLRARIEFALAAYAMSHDGKFPETLKELVPHYLDEVPLSTVTHKEVIYKIEKGMPVFSIFHESFEQMERENKRVAPR